VLEHQRKQAAIATLAEFFNALRLYRKQQTRVLLQFIDEFISDGRLIRIVGKKDARYVSLARAPGALKYDVVVDEAPTSPDQKERTWMAMQQLLPVASNLGLPVPPQVLEYAPLPRALIDDWLKFAEEGGMPPQARAKMQQLQEQTQALQQENQKLKSKQEETMAKLQADKAQSDQQMALKANEAQADQQLERQKFEAQMALEWQKFQANLQLEYAKIGAQNDIEQERMVREDMRLTDQADMEAATEPAEGESAPKPQPRTSGILESISNAQKETSEALIAMADSIGKLAAAQGAPKTISDGKGRVFTVQSGA
jgi:hypothetical protein